MPIPGNSRRTASPGACHPRPDRQRLVVAGRGDDDCAGPEVCSAAGACKTTQTVPIEGPYFLGDPQPRERTGTGLVLAGAVLDAASCSPVAGARVVRWHANRVGVYEDYFRALMVADKQGLYRLESIVPGAYAGLQRHVHFHVSAPGFQDLITQWQIADDLDPAPEIRFDFVLQPA